jgi:glycosyltransferase involved in cell wall biosynthesis
MSCPSTRYRGKYALEFLHANEQITYSFVVPGYSWKVILHFFCVYLDALFFRRKNSIIVIQKVHSNNIYAHALKLLVIFRRKNTVYDLDDAEYIRHDDGTLNFFIKKCAYVTVASQALMAYSSGFNKNVILNTSPVMSHQYRKTGRNDRLTVGWVGDMGNGNISSHDFSHKRSLFDLFFPSLLTISIPVKLILIGINRKSDKEEIEAYFSGIKNLEIEIPEKIDWQNENWLYGKIKEFDIGIAPLVDHEFNRAKSAFKVKQYLSCGVPVLASRIGENIKFIDPGKNGFFCNTREDFSDSLREFSSMTEKKYSEFSRNAFETRGLFTMEGYCKQILQICNND